MAACWSADGGTWPDERLIQRSNFSIPAITIIQFTSCE